MVQKCCTGTENPLPDAPLPPGRSLPDAREIPSALSTGRIPRTTRPTSSLCHCNTAASPAIPPRRTRPCPHSQMARTLRRNSPGPAHRSEEHTSELQSHHDLVCRLLLEKKKKKKKKLSKMIIKHKQ